MKMVKVALMSTGLVLITIFLLRKIPFTSALVNQALNG